ncbi:MAG TPA: hypothetical protein VGF95_14375 [Solirubrobacteraceae bacterium]|jgi:hypothetical protein
MDYQETRTAYVIRKIRRLRQLVPTKFATVVEEQHGTGWQPVFIRWWMWLGRSYRVERRVIGAAG